MSTADWIGIGFVLGALVAASLVVVAITWTWQEIVTMLRGWLDSR